MDKCRVNIACMEPSDIIFEGLSNFLLRKESHYYIFRVKDLEELNDLLLKEKLEVIILNPSILINRIHDFHKLRKNFPKLIWIGLIYAVFENELLSKFDDLINITDHSDIISERLNKILEKCNCRNNQQEELSERETEVLVKLLNGFANKEIADQLNISIHTVISHRKNIIEKTGIKSLPGLTIYAISQKIIPLE
ncbi:MAG: response regulator transcription factor [Bacteroidota bacterium]